MKVSTVIKKLAKGLSYILIGLILFVCGLVFTLYSPWVQQRALDAIRSYFGEMPDGMALTIGEFSLQFPVDVKLTDLCLTQNGDTIVAARSAEVSVKPLPLLAGKLKTDYAVLRGLHYAMHDSDSIMQMKIVADSIGLERADIGLADMLIRLDDVRIADCYYEMGMMPMIDTLSARLAFLSLTTGQVDMTNSDIHLGILAGDRLNLRYITPDSATVAAFIPPPTPTDTAAVQWTVNIDSIAFDNSSALYTTAGVHPQPGMDFAYIELDSLSLRSHEFYNCGTDVKIPLSVSGVERCGVGLDLAGILRVDSTALTLDDFVLSTAAGSSAEFSAQMGMGDLLADTSLPLRLGLSGAFAAGDMSAMFPVAAPILSALPSGTPLVANVDVNGTSGRLNLNELAFSLNRCVSLNVQGNIRNVFKPEDMSGQLDLNGEIINVNSIKNSLLEPETATGVEIPPMTLRGAVAMQRGVVEGNLIARTHSGNISLDADWDSNNEGYEVNVLSDSLPVQAFLPDMGIGVISSQLKVRGRGYSPFLTSTEIDASADIASVDYNGTTYRDIRGVASVKDGQATVSLNSDNSEIDFSLNASGSLDRETYDWQGTIDGRNLDLYSLGFSTEPCIVEVKADLEASVNPTQNTYSGHLNLHELYYRQLSGTIALSNLDAKVALSDSLSVADIVNRDFNAHFDSPCGLDSLLASMTKVSTELERQMQTCMFNADSLKQALPIFTLRVNSGRSGLLNDILSVYGMSMRQFDFDVVNDSLLTMDMAAIRVGTSTMSLDTLRLSGRQRSDHMLFKGSLHNAPGNIDAWHDVVVLARLAGNRLGTRITQKNLKGNTGLDLGMNLTANVQDTTLTLNLRPYNPIIGYKQWVVNDSNFVRYHLPTKQIDANLRMQEGNSSIALFTENKSLNMQLTDIHIQDWIAFNPFAPPMKGDVSADISLSRVNGQLVGNGSAGISRFIYGRQQVADFKAQFRVQADPIGGLIADADLLVNGQRTITVRGALNDSINAGAMDLDLRMIKFPLSTVNPFLPKRIGSLSGTLNGSLRMNGTADEPLMNGWMAFDSTEVKATMLGTAYKFSPDSIPIANNIVTINNFAIYGCNENPLRINGTVDLSSLANMNMNLQFLAQNMQLVNSKRAGRGADVYGKAFVDFDGKVNGSMQFMSVDANLTVLPETNITYVLPDLSAGLENYSNDDMVKFVNFTDSLALAKADSVGTDEMMLLIDAKLKVENGSIIGVDLSTNGSNRVQIEGNADLNFTMTPMNEGRVTGVANINRGYVRYGQSPILSEQLFKFKEGSNVSFRGDMMNPILNIHAVNDMKASVSHEGSNARPVNFAIDVAITGTLERMDVAFDLSTQDDITVANELETMSPEQRANQAMNLMLYRMYTGASNNSGSSLGNPLYGFLAGQLNTWAANTIKGVDLSFGIDQYDSQDGSSKSQTTSYSYQVSKSLFNDRFKIVVGGNYSTDAQADENFQQNLISDISFEYFINRNRTMYVRLFRHTGYESILEGEITKTGVGFVYRRKLSRLIELFMTPSMLRRSRERASQQVQSEQHITTENASQ